LTWLVNEESYSPMKKPRHHRDRPVIITLSTGYKVGIDVNNTAEGVRHLAHALMGEILVPRMKELLKESGRRKNKDPWPEGLDAAREELYRIIAEMSREDLWAMAYGTVWSQVIGVFDRMKAEMASAN